MPLASIVIDGGELDRTRLEARLLAYFPFDAFLRRLIDVGPAARQRPAAVADLAHHEDATIAEHCPTHIDLGRRVAQILLEQTRNALERSPGTVGEHGGGDCAHATVPLQIVGVGAESQAGLRNRLQFARPQ